MTIQSIIDKVKEEGKTGKTIVFLAKNQKVTDISMVNEIKIKNIRITIYKDYFNKNKSIWNLEYNSNQMEIVKTFNTALFEAWKYFQETVIGDLDYIQMYIFDTDNNIPIAINRWAYVTFTNPLR